MPLGINDLLKEWIAGDWEGQVHATAEASAFKLFSLDWVKRIF